MNLIRTTLQIVLYSYLIIWLTGCDRQEPVAPTDRKEIGFDIASLASTRSPLPKSQRGNTLIHKDSIFSMGIFGYSTSYDVTAPVETSLLSVTPNLIYNQKATRELERIENPPEPDKYILTSWGYNPVAYWPVDLSVRNSFFAYSPHSSDIPSAIMSLNTSAGTPKLTYTLPEEPTDMIDVLYSDPVLNKNRNSTEKVNDGRVVYDMKHALCWLSFVIAPVVYGNDDPEDPDAAYSVDWLSFMADNLPTTATIDLGTGKWTNMITDFRQYNIELTDAAQSIKPGDVALVIDENSRLTLLPFEINDAAGATIDITFWYRGTQYYYFAPFPTQRMTAGNIVVFVINISPDGATLTFQSEDRIENWLKEWEADSDFPDGLGLDIY
ncbi:fimbrillin family protein [Parabacteroides sp. PF5-9]|uniref:fimbrillin family protein n=1 Tax=Parabacteroides sp. PF5-9 TaxID=1742404 RepID=UPI002476A6A1|nr:fimbrillin family protein [Parabacteroides sp. PF5-9]MDH6357165.1 hypothetical protein [Parabacteroides sp. PF5-9]